MLNYRNTNLVFVAVFIIVLMGRISGTFTWYVPLLVFAVYISIISYGVFSIGRCFFIDSLCEQRSSQKFVALTFDDGPVDVTSAVLDVLKQHQVSAVFFCIGKNIESHHGILQRIIAEGHVIGNHTYSHSPSMGMMSSKRVAAEIDITNRMIREATGHQPLLFRPPYGVTNPMIAKAIQRSGMKSIGWSIRSLDTVINDPQKLLRRILKPLHPGAIILLHDRRTITAGILGELITKIKESGFKFVRADRLLNIEPYA